MGNWLYRIAVLALWLVAMGWLLTSKVLPPLLSGNAPDYSDILPSEAAEEPPVHWNILWNQAAVGRAKTEITRRADGTGLIHNMVSFRDLAIADLLDQFFGGAGTLLRPALAIDPNIRIDLDVESSTSFDHFGDLHRFDTSISMDGFPDLLVIRGIADNGKLKLLARISDSDGGQRVIFRQDLDLPPKGLVSDSLSPNSRLSRLRVGQTWTLQVYSPFSPTNPMELVQATVERREMIEWNGKIIRASLVVYRRDAGSGISAREPIARMWVCRDGTVVKQEVALASGKVVFIRLADDQEKRSDTAGPHREEARRER